MKCNICGNNHFVDMNFRIAVKCTKCGSLERTCLMYLYIHSMQIKKEYKILHLAPEKGIYNYLKKMDKGNYVVADIVSKKKFRAFLRKNFAIPAISQPTRLLKSCVSDDPVVPFKKSIDTISVGCN